MSYDTPERSSLDGHWEVISKSPSILYECLQAFPPLEVDTRPVDWSALGLGPNSGPQTGGIPPDVKLNSKSSLRLTKRRSKDTLTSASNDSVSAVPTSKKSFFKTIKIHRLKSKKNVDQTETSPNGAEFVQVTAAPVHTVTPKAKTPTRKHSVGLFNGPPIGSGGTMSLLKNAGNDKLIPDLIPRLYFTLLPTTFESDGQKQPIPSAVLEQDDSMILALKPRPSFDPLPTIDEVSETSTPATFESHPPFNIVTYRDQFSPSEAAEPLFFRSRDHPLPIGHLASLTFIQIHPDGLVTLYEMVLTWIPLDESLPACRITVTRGFGSISRFADALFHIYSPEASPHLLALLSEFPKPSDGPTHPYKVDYRVGRMQRYFDRLFGLQAPDNSNFVLNDPRITPEFFAVLAKDHGDYISRKKAWAEWQCTLQKKQGIEQRVVGMDVHSKADFAHEKAEKYEYDTLMAKIIDSGLRPQQPKPRSRSGKISKETVGDEDTDVSFTELNNVFPLAPPRALAHPLSSNFSVDIFAPINLLGNSLDNLSLVTVISVSSIPADRPWSVVFRNFHSSHSSGDTSLFGTPNTSVSDLTHRLPVVKPQEDLPANSRTSSEATLSKLGVKNLRLNDENVISFSLTARFYFKTIRVVVDFAESWETILSHIYLALQLPANSRKRKSDMGTPSTKHIGSPHEKEIELNGREAFMKWLSVAGDLIVWVEDWLLPWVSFAITLGFSLFLFSV
ncbi:hypothetical protein, variant [Cryptococcus neoformans var. grubii H99]|nr:hypothetical protein, variant [Cryptococcus neoformans var. grubii H99]AGV14187.1 hypothetical protein, variant [Cryptococcus neoformans var. grubii H99]AUB23629.1 hypothetical protein CKF44_02665 [Cryptococcus neoformans var. grubii]|eukprot:XP_012048059.1 hypothetical protein, variant [Cryptococcus neoformans var. grubii H99]